MKRTIPLVVLATATVLVLPQTAEAAAACAWAPTQLPYPAGVPANSFGGIYATDHNGGYAGLVYFDGGSHVVSWKGGTVTDHGGFPQSRLIEVEDENRAGTIVGTVTYPSPSHPLATVTKAVRIRANGQREELPALPGGRLSTADAINDRGDVVGTMLNGQGNRVVVRWPGDRPTEVEQLPGIPAESRLRDLDQDGTVLVEVLDSNRYPRPHLWRNGLLTRLQAPPSTRDPSAVSISNGRVAGGALSPSGVGMGVYWEANGVPHVLPRSVEVQRINRHGLMAGSVLEPGGAQGVWRLDTFEASFGSDVHTFTVSDDGTVGGKDANWDPTVWRCT